MRDNRMMEYMGWADRLSGNLTAVNAREAMAWLDGEMFQKSVIGTTYGTLVTGKPICYDECLAASVILRMEEGRSSACLGEK